MLAALLCHAPFSGGLGRVDEEKAKRALEQLRKEYFERQKEQKQEIDSRQVYTILKEEAFHIPVLPSETATLGDRVGDDEELALLLILAEI